MHTAETSSPEEEVPEVVSELKSHRWKVRPVRLVHFTVQKWTPYGKAPANAPNAQNFKTTKNARKHTEFVRNLRPRMSGEPDESKPKDIKSDPVYALILKTISCLMWSS
jgi:hypothetical protein